MLHAWLLLLLLLLAALAHPARPSPHHHPLSHLLQSQTHPRLSNPPDQNQQQQPSDVCLIGSGRLGVCAVFTSSLVGAYLFAALQAAGWRTPTKYVTASCQI
jgi:hypothetical protein